METITNNIIHYEEDIFYLKLFLNNLSKANLLNINHELFNSKIKQDIEFIHKSAKIIYEHLLQNNKLITKHEQLHSILTLKVLFINEIKLLNNKQYININDFLTIVEDNNKDISNIEKILSNLHDNNNKEDLTTNEELNILMNFEGIETSNDDGL